MRKVLTVLIVSFSVTNIQGQEYNDTIITHKNDTINCKITLDNGSNLFYNFLKGKKEASEMISLFDVDTYIYNNQRIKPTDFKISKEDSIKYNGTRYIYCELVGTGKLFSNKVTVSIDYGQSKSFWSDEKIKDKETGGVKIFNSMIDGMNYMGAKGWIFVQAFVVTHVNTNVYHYVLKKKLD